VLASPRSRRAWYRQGRGLRPRRPCPRPSSSAIAASASAAPANPRAATRCMGSATGSASCAWAAA